MLSATHLNALFEILSKIHFIYEPDALWQLILEQACVTLHAEAGTFFEFTDNSEQLRVAASYPIPPEKLSVLPFKVGVGISGWVAQYQKPALVNNVKEDHRFNSNFDLVTGFSTKSILCIPVFSQNHAYGVLEIINRTEGLFSPQDQEFMTLLGRQSAVAYHNLLLMADVQKKETLLASLMGSLSGGLVAMDNEERITVLNPSCARLLALPDESYIGKPAPKVLKEIPWVLERLRETRKDKKTVSRVEAQVYVQGTLQRFGYSTILISNGPEQILGAGLIFQKLT